MPQATSPTTGTERIYLGLSFLGAALAIGLFIPLVLDQGLSFDLLRVFDYNSMALIIAVDLLLVTAMFLVWSWRDSRHNGVRGWPIVLLLTIFVAVSCGLPFYLYLRSRAGVGMSVS